MKNLWPVAVLILLSVSLPGHCRTEGSISLAQGLLPAILLLLIVIFVSSIFRKAPHKPEVLNDCSLINDLFNFSEFPTAVFDLELRLVAANENFSTLFKISNNRSFYLLQHPILGQIPSLVRIFTSVKESKIPPELPIFLNSEDLVDKTTFAANYLIIRKLTSSQTNEKFLVLIIVESKYSKAFANDLTLKIAQRDSDLRKLEELDQLKSEFLATLSHELKTPLVSVKGYLDLMASGKMGPLTEKQEKAIRVSLKNTSHLNTLISSILNFARMEAGKLLFDLVHQKLAPHINDIIDSMKPIADSRQISIITDIADPLPLVIIDTELIHRVLINLLENAIKFSLPGSQVIVAANRQGDNLVKVQVKDQGRGIPAEKLEKIKTPFYQADKSDTRPTGGLGLGLAIAEKILIGHGTSLQIDSKEDVGTTCSFSLKVAPPRA